MNAGEIVARLEKLRGLDGPTAQGAISILIGDITREAHLERCRERLHDDRTVQVGAALLSIEDFRACVVVQPPHPAWPHTEGPISYVWLRDMRDSLLIPGDHAEALRAAVEGQP